MLNVQLFTVLTNGLVNFKRLTSSVCGIFVDDLHMTCGGFEVLSSMPKPELATKRNLAGRHSPAISYMLCCTLVYFNFRVRNTVVNTAFPF